MILVLGILKKDGTNFIVIIEYMTNTIMGRLEYPVLARTYLQWTKNAHCKRGDSVMIKKCNSFVEMVAFTIKKINC